MVMALVAGLDLKESAVVQVSDAYQNNYLGDQNYNDYLKNFIVSHIEVICFRASTGGRIMWKSYGT